jgi:hypothetical protein
MKPKYDIKEKVFVVVNKTVEVSSACPACTDGFITLKDNETYSCPRCYGSGKTSDYTFSYEADPKPRFITGIDYSCQMNHGRLAIDANYFWMAEIDPQHSVYLDSVGGDERGKEEMLYPTYEAAVEGAKKLTEKARLERLEQEKEEQDYLKKDKE